MNSTCFAFPTPSPGHAAWVADPSCRGTFNIALLCLSTTLICIWSSVHRDIPFESLSTFRSLRRDTPLVLVALFAPELIFVNSYLQFAQETTASTSQQGNIIRQNQFTLVHGFYATMGGFAFIEPEGYVSEGQRVKLTAAGVKFFMKYEPDLIPDLSLTAITDRQKSNSLGKALLVVQVFWFCLNCISRLVERLPLSLLEVSTLAHGIFTLSSYVMWWSKPLSIDEPTWIPLDGEHAREAYALLNTIHDTFFYPVSFKSVPDLSNLFEAHGFATLSNSVLYRFTDYVVTTCIPLIYGFLHFLALRAEFPTSVERSLWRIASVVVTSSGAFEVLFDFIRNVCFDVLALSGSLKQTIGNGIIIVHYRIIPFFYLLGSGYLLVESIRQLWYLPHDAYVVASWSYYIPHWL
ncbi:hypothetical protein SCHPADRAFT_967008 [Schizopora paradoxa]|uniref:Uncharacterized protein n=1 Tax=Schizopora paradoxa TaxID=27342 RepID=A0A0H2RR28_9AGAM|nr:hypothetical protein SCHPADRAFT_967008 [Schizopora paradoxa]